MNYYRSTSPTKYKRTVIKQALIDLWESDWFIWFLVAVILGVTYWGTINWLDDAIQKIP